jgi:nucleoside-diphosphate-sugar epimerase
MFTALLTGALGFTGQVMKALLLERGIHVISLQSDLTDREAVQQEVARISPDWVIHLAALSFVGDADLEAFYRVNVFGTLNLLDALGDLKQPPSRILIASSANIYGVPAVEVIDEGVVPAPVNHYACSKLVMEHMVSPWFERLPIVITRPFNYTGLGQDERFLIPKIVSHFVRKSPHIELGNIDVSRDFSDVRDVACAYLNLLDSNACGVKVNICSGRVTSLRDVIEYMNALAGYTIEVRVNPLFVRANEIPVLRGDNCLLRTLTGSVPMIPIEETLQRMYASLCEAPC